MGDKERKEVDPSALAALIRHIETADEELYYAHGRLFDLGAQGSETTASIDRIQDELKSLITRLHPTVIL